MFTVTDSAPAQTPAPVEGYWLGESRGPQPTGTLRDVWVDGGRAELFASDPAMRRHLTIQIWYPAQLTEGSEHAAYAPDFAAYQQWMRDGLRPIAFRPTLSVYGAEAATRDAPFPVLVYNHGASSQAFSATHQTEFLASHGYVVVSVGHTDIDGRVEFPDGSRYAPERGMETLTQEQRVAMSAYDVTEWRKANAALQAQFAEHVNDVTFVLDTLTALERDPAHPLHGRLELSRVGAFGWSIGGATAMQALQDDNRIVAAVNLDGELMGRPVESTGSAKPVLLVQSQQSGARRPAGVTNAAAEESLAEMNRRIWLTLRRSKAEWFRAVVIGTNHLSFSDAYRILDPPDDVPDIRQSQSIVNTLLLEFFDRHLKGENASPILSGSRQLPGLTLARGNPGG